MRQAILILILSSFFYCAFTQVATNSDFNFGFEKISSKGQLPDHWYRMGTEDYKLISDFNEKHSGEASLSIELVGTNSANSFGSCGYSIPAIYQGNQIELRAYMKLQKVENGRIGLMLRIDGQGGVLQFDNMMQKNINGTSEWKQYSVILPLHPNSKNIVIGPILHGTGKIWIDDVQLLIDGEDISKAKIKEQKLFKADTDKEFDKGSGISNFTVTPTNIENLAIFGKVWGFLKYYHPTVAKGDYNWDYELFRILPEIIRSQSDLQRNEILQNWITSLGEIPQEISGKSDTSLINLLPDFTWINNSKFGEDLIGKLNAIRKANRSNGHYYIDFVAGVGNPQFKNEKPYSQIPLITDAGFKLLALFRYWNIIQYYSPNKNLIEENWDNVLREFIPKFVNATTDLDYKLSVLALIARVHDTHANVWGNEVTLQKYKGVNYAPVEVKFIQNQAVVTDFIKTQLPDKPILQKGDIILSVNNKKIDEILREKLPITPASNYPTQLRDIARDLLRTNDSILSVTYKRNNSVASLKIRCYSSEEINIYENYIKKDTCFKLVTPEIGYLYPGTIKNSYLPKIMEIVQNRKGLIIDLRCYPSEFIVFTLSGYLMPESTNFVKFSVTSLANPGLYTYTNPLKVGKNNPDYYKGKIVIIVNERTQSQAEYTAMALRTAPLAVVIGSTTAGADGNVSQFFLPGGISTLISGIGVFYPDGKGTQRVGIIPDITVKPTINGIKHERDELLEKAIDLINKK